MKAIMFHDFQICFMGWEEQLYTTFKNEHKLYTNE